MFLKIFYGIFIEIKKPLLGAVGKSF